MARRVCGVKWGGGGVAMASTVARDASRPSVEPADADENDAAKAGG